jgi:hypothetical protein
MIQQKRREQTWMPIKKSQLLPPLQRRIFLNLAKKDPQTINETAKAIKGHYKSSWLAFNSLEKKGMIRKVASKKYRGNEYPCFWITESGVFIALLEGANPATLLEKTLKIYPKNKDLQYLLEISPILGTDAFNVAFSAILGKGQLEPIDTTTIMVTQMQKKLSSDEVKQIITILKKYPEQYRQFRENVEQLRESVQILDSI